MFGCLVLRILLYLQAYVVVLGALESGAGLMWFCDGAPLEFLLLLMCLAAFFFCSFCVYLGGS
jgi:hypothetical protein